MWAWVNRYRWRGRRPDFRLHVEDKNPHTGKVMLADAPAASRGEQGEIDDGTILRRY
jgi:hypothetical protein